MNGRHKKTASLSGAGLPPFEEVLTLRESLCNGVGRMASPKGAVYG